MIFSSSLLVKAPPVLYTPVLAHSVRRAQLQVHTALDAELQWAWNDQPKGKFRKAYRNDVACQEISEPLVESKHAEQVE